MNLKKIITLMFITLPTFSFSATKMESINPFLNLYLGAGVGFNTQFFLGDYLDGSKGTHHWVNFGNYGVSGHVYTGYNHEFKENSLLGVDAHAQFNGASPSKHYHNNILFFESNQLPWQFGISIKPGYVYKNNLFYLLAGPEWAQLKDKDVSNSGITSSFSSYQFGGLFGFGVSQNIKPGLNIVEQFSYGLFRGVSNRLPNNSNSKVNHPTEATAMLALEYHFN